MKVKKINKFSDRKCNLLFYNKLKSYIKNPERIFFLIAKKNCIRGNHAHKVCNQFFFSLKDKVELLIDDGKKKKKIYLKPGQMLKIKPLLWVSVKLKKNQIVCVIFDKTYYKNEYLRDYKKFIKLKNS